MKKKDLQNLHTAKTAELIKQADAVRIKISEVLMQVSAGKAKNVREAKNLRKKLATILTVLNEKEKQV